MNRLAATLASIGAMTTLAAHATPIPLSGDGILARPVPYVLADARAPGTPSQRFEPLFQYVDSVGRDNALHAACASVPATLRSGSPSRTLTVPNGTAPVDIRQASLNQLYNMAAAEDEVSDESLSTVGDRLRPQPLPMQTRAPLRPTGLVLSELVWRCALR